MAEESHLVHVREILKSSIEKSRNIAIAVDETGSRLNEISHNLADMEAAIKSMASKCEVYKIRSHVDRAIAPAAAVVKVVDLVYELRDSLETTDTRLAAGLFTYLASIKRLQEALKLLSDNCRLVILWLQDVVQILKNNNAAAADDDDDHWYLVHVSKVLRILVELQSLGQLDGGVLSPAFDKLESEYRRLLLTIEEDSYVPAASHVIQGLQSITEVLTANNRLDKCTSTYTQVRISYIRATLQALNADYLDIKLSEIDSVQCVEVHIDQWDKHMEFVVRHLLQKEYNLCSEVYHNVGSDDIWINCFAEIATQCGFFDIIDFGNSVCKCKKEAIKLLNLLKIFSTLDKLRLQFNDMFDGRFCIEIQNRTRALVKNVVHGACEIFWELLAQVELQRAYGPPSNGNVPRLVCFVTEYCNKLLENDNSLILVRILEIFQVWNQVKFEEGIVFNEINSIMRTVEMNLEAWAQSYDDLALSYFFMMNSYWYLCNSTRGTKLGELMGESWLWAYEEYTEYYMRESWEKLLVNLREEGLILFPGGRAIDRNLVKKRIRVFCEAFDEMYKKQCKWMLHDKALRWKTCQLIIEAVVVPYKRYLQRFMPAGGLERESGKYTGERVEDLIGSLFQLKLGKYSSSKCTDLIGIIKNAANMNHLSSTPAAA